MATVSVRKQMDDQLIPDDQQASTLFPALAYSPDDELFYMQDFSIGFSFICEPLPGGDEKVQERISSFLNNDYPEGTMVQLALYRSPDITAHTNHALQIRDVYDHPLLTPAIQERINFFKRYSNEPLLIKSNRGTFDNGLVQDLKLVVAFKVPIASSLPSDREISDIKTMQGRAKSSLNMVGLMPRAMDAKGYKRFMGTLCNWGQSASWKTGYDEWEQERLLSEQILDFDAAVEVKRDHLEIGDHYVRTLSAKKLPPAFYFGNAISYIGDISGRGDSVKENYMVVATVYYPPAKKSKDKLEAKRKFTISQAQGPILKFVPILAEKKDSFDILYNDLGNGAAPLQMSFSVVMFAPTLERLDRASTAIKGFFSEQRFSLMEDRYVHLPMFLNSLPFCCDRNSVSDLHRYKTMTGNQAAVLVPVFGEWKGTGTHHLSLLSRNGQMMSLSLHDSDTNKNCVIAAESGSGKSFLANDAIISYMSEGAQVWIIDAGKSYKNLCEVLDGDFLEFSEGSNIKLNPFELVQDYKDEEDALVSLVTAMASQDGNLDEYQIASLKRVMAELWDEVGNKMTVDLIADRCLQSDDRRVTDIGTQLYPFTMQGAYGSYFDTNNINFQNNLTVLELDELQGRRHLRQVILLQLIYQIQQAVFLGDRNKRKILLIDEAWDLIKEGEIATFMEHAYRKFRKANASAVICTQSINDLYQNTVGQAIAENSATMLLLGQTAETVESVKKSGYLALPEGGFDVLRTVNTIAGVYSEIFIKAKRGMGVGRLIVGEFQKLLYSTDPTDVNAINAYKKRGMNVTDAIRAVMADRGVE
ncbi:type IV secretion system protein TraC [Vreelandella massiliensis]|uniref:type IV secretion system protein TraC n=1 Tax=Vreelandella massiliensis TaxID=1816686 RepID=UPI0009F994D1|nr:type IV secretion system protein TraC [Halomonas massiliensis]